MMDNLTNHPARPAHDIIAALTDLFPQAFAAEKWQPHRPLKIGIHLDLAASDIMTPSEAQTALRSYARRRMYLVAVAAGGTRIDLNGNPAGEVTPAEAAWARERLAHMDAQEVRRAADGRALIEAHRAARAAAEKRDAAPAASQPPREKTHRRASASVYRDSLADLRAAAAARRAANLAPDVSISVRRAASGGP
jgi:ProP effector